MWKYSIEDEIFKRIIEEAYYIVDNEATIRQTADVFKVSKSTVYKDVTEKLQKCNPILAEDVRRVLSVNKVERYIRGGLATKRKYVKNKIDS